MIERLVPRRLTTSCAASTCSTSPTAQSLTRSGVIAAFLHATRLGLFELSWNVLCPGCGGVLDTAATLQDGRQRRISVRLVRRRLRADPRRDRRGDFHGEPAGCAGSPRTIPNRCRSSDYFRQIFWSSGIDLRPTKPRPRSSSEITLETIELPPGDKAILSLQLPPEFLIVFDPVTHRAQFIDVKGEPTRERQAISLLLNKTPAPTETMTLRPGPLRLPLENRAGRPRLPAVWVGRRRARRAAGPAPAVPDSQAAADQPDLPRHLSHRHDRRRSAAENHQSDVPVHRSEGLDRTLRPGRRPRRLRSRARAFSRADEIVAAEAGAVVKTIGDAVMATFPTPRPRRCRGPAHARGDARLNEEPSATTCCSRSASMKARALRSCSTSGRTISARPSTSPRACRAWPRRM